MAKSTNKRSYRKHRKPRKTRRNKKQRGGTHTVITIDDIITSITDTSQECCGYIDEVGNYVLNDIGLDKKETSRGTCNQLNMPIIWHTHSSASKYYPSIEDINKVLKHPEINSSTIYTRYGYWKLNYTGKRILTTDEIQVINDILARFYHNTTKGREYNRAAINELVSSINSAIGEGFISWTDWSEKNT
jgi:hypothetical protein